MPRRSQVANPPPNEKHQRYSEHGRPEDAPDNDVEAMSEDSFPASDPPSYSSARAGRPEREKEKKKRDQVRKHPGKTH